jgi:hypothetical protein
MREMLLKGKADIALDLNFVLVKGHDLRPKHDG